MYETRQVIDFLSDNSIIASCTFDKVLFSIMNKNDELQKKIITSQQLAFDWGESLYKDSLVFLDEYQYEIEAAIIRSNPKTIGGVKHKRLEKLLKETTILSNKVFDKIKEESRHQLIDFAQKESEITTKAISEVVKVEVAAPILLKNDLKGLVDDTLFEGAFIWEVWDKEKKTLNEKIKKQLRQGIFGGETTPQIVNRITGGVDGLGNQQPGIINKHRNDVERLVITTANAVGNNALLKTYQNNSDIIDGVMHSATLQTRTCARCGGRSEKVWRLKDYKPVGHSFAFISLPLHPRCRCLYLPTLIGEPMPGRLTYKKWFEGLSEGRQIKVLGPSRHNLWKSGKVSLEEFSNSTTGDLIKLSDLT